MQRLTVSVMESSMYVPSLREVKRAPMRRGVGYFVYSRIARRQMDKLAHMEANRTGPAV